MKSIYEMSWLERVLWLKRIKGGSFVLKTVKDLIASFSDCIGGKAKSVVCDIVPSQSGSGTPSPDNVRPISGWTATDVNVCGKNLSSVNANPANPYAQWGGNWVGLVNVLNTLPIGQYTISNKYKIVEMPANGKVQHGRPYITAMVNGSQVGVLSYSVSTDASPTLGKVYTETGTFTITENNKGKINHAYLYCDQADTHSGTGRGLYDCYDVQIELGSTASDYQPYQGQTYEVNWSDEVGTIYGGTVDAVSGVVTVDRVVQTVTELGFTYQSQYQRFYTSAIKNIMLIPPSSETNVICEAMEVVADNVSTPPANSLSVAQSGNVFIYNTTYTSKQDLEDDIGTTKVCYMLKEPLTYQLSEQQIALLKGQNNVWSTSGGETEVTYKAEAE